MCKEFHSTTRSQADDKRPKFSDQETVTILWQQKLVSKPSCAHQTHKKLVGLPLASVHFDAPNAIVRFQSRESIIFNGY